ncbi:MAG: chemotaxis protein CheW [Pseudomonadales bacterium]|nr:chemotaxis protein CheW [Pseudomonadales bacterium]
MSQALEILSDIASNTLRYAAQLPSPERKVDEWQGLGFQLGGVRLVAEVGEVAEMLLVPRLTRLPGVKNWVMGMANVRGRLVPIIDLHRYLGIPNSGPRILRRVMVVESADLIAGLVVEQSLGMQHFMLENFDQGLPDGLHKMHAHLDGAYRHGGRIFYVAKLKKLISDEQFMDVSE